MIYLIGAISLVSLALNILIYKRVTATYPVGVLEEFETEKIELEPELEEPVEEVPEAPVKSVEGQSNYQGWVNKTNIPLFESVSPPPPSIKEPVNRAPLARPDGFV